ncbi:MAG: C-terminal binding protein [Azospirillaceae bacterium]|nr:C-terminal binding protein [Azospirillaceae bacterium]
MTAKFTVGIVGQPMETLDLEEAVLGPEIRLVRLSGVREDDLDPAELGRLDALLVWRMALGARTANLLTRGRIVVRFSVGYDNIDVAAFTRAGIAFANNPDYGTEEVADSAMALILGLQRRIVEYDSRARGHTTTWQANILPPVRRSRTLTVGVVGVGRIGTSVVNRLKPFGYHIAGFDPYQPSGHEKAIGYQRTESLNALLAMADILTLHCPLTPETTGMIDTAAVERLKPGSILVNTARGRLVADLDTIAAALRTGRLAAAGLDVLPDEPPRPHPLLDAWRRREDWLDGRLIITPHVAFYADEAWIEQRRKGCETARLCLVEGRLRNLINPDDPASR